MGKKANKTVQMATSSNNKMEIKAKPKRLRRLNGGTSNVCVYVVVGGCVFVHLLLVLKHTNNVVNHRNNCSNSATALPLATVITTI